MDKDFESMTDEELEAIAGGGGFEKMSDEQLSAIAGQPEPQTWGDYLRQKTAAGLIGARETLPFAKDIASGTKAITGGKTFAEAKEDVEAQQRAAQEESPLAYGAGEVGAFFAPLPGPKGAGSLAELTTGVERFLSGKLAPKIGKTAADIAAAGAAGAGLGAVQGAGEGTGLSERLESAATTGALGAGLGAALPAAGKTVGAIVRRTPAEEAAARLGVSIPASVSSPSGITQKVSSGLSQIPVTESIIKRGIERGVSDVGEKLASVAPRAGIGAEEAGATARKSLIDWVDVDSRGNVNKLYNKVSELIDPGVLTPMSNTLDVVSKIGKERLAAKLGDSEAVKLVMDAATDPQGLTYAGAQRLKREIGSKMKGILTESNLNAEELDQLYRGLRADVRAAAKNAGGDRGLAAFDRAVSYAKNVIARRQELGKIIGKKGDVNDEQVFKRISAMAGDTRGNAELLKKARKSMSPAEWQDITSGVITHLSGGEGAFSPDKFVTAYSKLTPAGKDAIFGPAGNPLRQSIDDINTVAQQYKEVGKGRNFSNTTATLLAAVGVLGAGTDVLMEGIDPALRHAGTAAGIGIPVAMLLSRPRAAAAIAAALRNQNPETLRNLRNVVQMEMREHLGPTPNVAEDREERASGGKIGKRDYPAKRLTRLERAARRALTDIANETKPILSQPDALVVKALEISKD